MRHRQLDRPVGMYVAVAVRITLALALVAATLGLATGCGSGGGVIEPTKSAGSSPSPILNRDKAPKAPVKP